MPTLLHQTREEYEGQVRDTREVSILCWACMFDHHMQHETGAS